MSTTTRTFIIVSTVLLLFLSVFIGAIVQPLQDRGHLYSFSLFITSPYMLYIFFLELLLIGAVFIVGIRIVKKSTGELRAVYAILMVFMIIFILYRALNYGHIDKKGISYNSLGNFLITKNYDWSQVNDPIYLNLEYWNSKNPNFHYILVLRTNDPQQKMLQPSFNNYQEGRDSLLATLKILTQKHKKIIAYSDNYTMYQATHSDTIFFFKQIQAITPIIIAERKEYYQNEYK